MTARSRFTSLARSPRLFRRSSDEPPSYWTEALGDPPSVYGERVYPFGDRTLRRWEAGRSKLGAAIVKGWVEPLPKVGERWLYLGASTGTTASHVADLVGPSGAVFAVEKSLRPFARLLSLAERYPNLAPLLGDARRSEAYLAEVPPVDGLYLDVAQPDQAQIAWTNARRFLRSDGALLLVLKTSSMGRDLGPRGHLDRTLELLSEGFELARPVGLDPFHRRHFLIGAWPTKRLFKEESVPQATRGARAIRPLAGSRS